VSSGRAWSTAPGRVEAFSDGVFAIAITLLVLDLRPPESAGEFRHDLVAEWPSYLAYIAAFVMIGSVWLHHHVVFSVVRRVDLRLALVNLVLLLLTSVLPFPTAVVASAWRLGDSSDESVSIAFFAAVSIGLTLAYGWLCGTVRRHPDLLREPSAGAFLDGERRRLLVATLALAAAALVAVVWPLVGLLMVAVSPAFFLSTLAGSALPSDVPEEG
jgi:uncharacterized membrane protein